MEEYEGTRTLRKEHEGTRRNEMEHVGIGRKNDLKGTASNRKE